MSHANEPHVLHWDCKQQGCFNEKKRLKFRLLSDCLPGKIAFTDIDAITEINGNLLSMEWKSHPSLTIGQRLLFERMTRFSPATVLFVVGDPEDMSVESVRVIWHGIIGQPQPATLNSLRELITDWAKWAVSNPID